MAALRALDRATLHLLLESQRAGRRAALRALDASLSVRHAAAIAAVVSRFAHLRDGARNLDAGARAAALNRLAAEEANELATLALVHAAEKRALRQSVSRAMQSMHKQELQRRRRTLRRQRAVLTVALRQGVRPRSKHVVRSRVPSRFKPATRR